MQCGRSCDAGWSTVVDRGFRARAKHTEAFAQAREQGYIPLRLRPDRREELAKKDDGTCVFLNAERLCTIHAESGGETKPHTCQRFPFHPISSPGGYYLGLSFYCTAVREGRGRKVEVHREFVNQIIRTEAANPAFAPFQGDRVQLAPGLDLSWQDYLGFEHKLQASWSFESLEGDLIAAVFEVLDEQPNGPVQDAMLQMVETFFPTLVSLAESPRDAEPRGLIAQKVADGQPYFSPRLGKEVATASPDPNCSELVMRYFQHVLFRKFLIGGDLVGRLLYLILVKRGLHFFASQAAGGVASEEHMWEALGVVEQNLMIHVSGLDGIYRYFSERVLGAIAQSA